jgi:E3 ubiquitin-protein ligase HUWE1
MRDFYIELSRQMFNPNYSLYTLTDNGVSHYFNTQSYINPDHLSFIKFTGRMVGKALFDGQYMDCYFAKPLYKMILGEDLTFKDLEDLDNDLFKNLAWGIENDLTELEQYFSVDKDFFGRREEIDLCPNGRNLKVTNENKLKWIELRVHFYLYGRVKD